MGKRKHRDDSAIRRKIRRLEKKLSHSKRNKGHGQEQTPYSSDTSSDQINENGDASDYENEYLKEDSSVASIVTIVRAPTPAPVPDPAETPAPGYVTMSAMTATVPSAPIPEPNQSSSLVVPDEILEVLGQAKLVEEILGEKIPVEISERWGKILLDGLAKEQKESIMKKILMPENFLLARAPKLNMEVNAVLSDTAKNRDKRLEKAQNQLGSGIAGLVNLTKDLIQSDIPKLDIIKRLSEISQILLDLHYEETMNRRKLIVPLLDKKFWSTIQGVKRETYLFGDKLGENIKNSKDIERSSQQIKKTTTMGSNFQRKPPMSGNVRPPPRQPNNARMNVAANPYYEHQQAQSSTSARRNPSSTHQPRHNRTTAGNKPRNQRRR